VGLWAGLSSGPSLAANIPHHDVRSLAYQSEAVVLATAVDGIRNVDVQTFKVLTTYRGPLVAGKTFTANWEALSLVPYFDGPEEWSVADEVVMFLERGRGGEWRLVSSGLRIFVDDHAYRFVQRKSPGPYYPTAQGIDPYDLYGDPRAGEGQTREQFLNLIPTRVQAADAFAKTLAQPDRPGIRDQLLDDIGPALGQDNLAPTALSVARYGFEDVIATEVINHMLELGDVERALEGVSRIRGGVLFRYLRLSSDHKMVGYARDTARPMHHRLAALELIEHHHVGYSMPVGAMISLLTDPSPSIRAAAVAAGPRDDLPSAWQQALIRQAAVETHQKVLYEIVKLGQRAGFDKDLRLTNSWPIVTATRRGRSVSFGWTDGPENWSLEGLVIAAHTTAGTREVTLVPPANGSHVRIWHDGSSGGYALFSPPLPDEKFTLDVRATFVGESEVRPITLALRPVGTGLAVSDGDCLHSRAGTQATEHRGDPEAVGSPPGCLCTAEAQPPMGHEIGVWVILLAWIKRWR